MFREALGYSNCVKKTFSFRVLGLLWIYSSVISPVHLTPKPFYINIVQYD
jgi:hypothetical protein